MTSDNSVPAQNKPAGPFRNLEPLILASGSPRRRRFLTDLGLTFTVVVPDIEEKAEPGESPADFVWRLALHKAADVAIHHPASWILAADTVVVLDNEILGKPADAADAVRMLLRLSGRTHRVLTGFCLRHARENRTIQGAATTDVLFAPFGRHEAEAYAATGEPLDKAGAYGIQGKGGFLVQRIDGSYSNVVGLPLAEVVEAMVRRGVIAPAIPSGGDGER